MLLLCTTSAQDMQALKIAQCTSDPLSHWRVGSGHDTRSLILITLPYVTWIQLMITCSIWKLHPCE